VFHGGSVYAGTDEPYLFGRLRVNGPDPQRGSYRSFAAFRDPDGNGWLFLEVTTRLPGRGLSINLATLTELLRETEKRHGEYEPTAPKHHWSGWYAAYIVDATETDPVPSRQVSPANRHGSVDCIGSPAARAPCSEFDRYRHARFNDVSEVAQFCAIPHRLKRGESFFHGRQLRMADFASSARLA
jgi:hypothetical protein